MAEQTVGIRITGDASGVVAASRAAAQSQRGMAEEFKRSSETTKEQAEEARRFVERLREEAEALGKGRAELERYRAEKLQLTDAQRREAESSIASMEAHKRNEDAVKLASRAAAAAAGAAIAYATSTAFAVKSIIDQRDELQKLSQSLAVGTEFMSAFRYQGELAGVKGEQLNTVVRNLARNVEEAKNGVGDGGRLFRALGVEIEAAAKSGASMEQLLPMIADAFQRLPDGSTKTALSIQLFGRGAERMIPLLNAGSAGMREMTEEARQFGLIVESSSARQAEQFNDNLTRLNAALTAGKRILATEYLPVLVEMTEKLVAATKATGSLWAGLAALAMAKEGRGGQDIDARVREIDATIAANEKLINQPRPWYQVADIGGFLLDSRNRRLANERAYLVTQRPQTAKPATSLADWMEPGGYGNADEARVRDALRKQPKEKADRDELTPLVKQFTEMKAAADARAESTDRLTQAEQRLVKVEADYAAGLTKLKPAEMDAVRAKAQLAIVAERAAEQRDAQRKADEAAATAYLRYLDGEAKAVAQMAEGNRRLAEHNEEIGVTGEALGLLRVRRAEESAALERQRAAMLDLEVASEREIKLAAERVRQAEEFVRLTRQGVDRAAGDERRKKESEETGRLRDDLNRAVTDGIYRGFENGKSFGRNFVESLRNAFATTVFRPVISAIVDPITAPWADMIRGISKGVAGAFGNNTAAIEAQIGIPELGLAPQVLHAGGIVGADAAPTRSVSARLFRGAPRYHEGAILQGERPAILKDGEGVFTPAQMRALGGGADRAVRVEIVNSGTPQRVTGAQPSFDARGAFVRIFTEDLRAGGPMAQALENTFAMPRAAG